MTGLYMQHIAGTNEYRYWLSQEMEYLVREDVNRPPLSTASLTHPVEYTTEFFARKAAFVLRMLELHIGKEHLYEVGTCSYLPAPLKRQDNEKEKGDNTEIKKNMVQQK